MKSQGWVEKALAACRDIEEPARYVCMVGYLAAVLKAKDDEIAELERMLNALEPPAESD